ncbi:MAG: hybrid sensor histidine kinase/response regulator [Desulfocapsaceae bacterium]|nr:hybrid sensor histidine kinase/response regulator [Desulfocapsaceae bacterium]
MALDIKKFISRFVEEAREHVKRLGEGLDTLSRDSSDRENINAIFRSAHTIKGSSRMLKLTAITETAHKLEDVLGAMRDGSLNYRPELGNLLYRSVDAIALLVESLATSGDPATLQPVDVVLCASLAQAATGEVAVAEAPLSCIDPAKDGVPAVVKSASSPSVIPSSLAVPPPPPSQAKLNAADTVRVRLAKLDELIKLMGEVVSSHATLRQRLLDFRMIERDGSPEHWVQHRARLHHFGLTLRDDVQSQELLMDELHDKALIMRMLPLSMVFDSAGRVVRDLAHSVGKEVACVVSGAEIELDRQMIDKLSDPIVHLLRNAIDHGLETPVERVAAGKSSQGRVTLSARQDGGWVVIEVADDGGGVPIEAVREKALRKGFISVEQASGMSDQEVVDLIFQPGFSTSTIITDISGRGVGMDVVRQSIVDDLQGEVTVETRLGTGTTFALRLPLSLAVMRVLLVEVNGLPFGVIAQYVAELIRVSHEEMLTVVERKAVIIRNEFVPVVALADLLHVPERLVKTTRSQAGISDRGMLLVVVRVRNEKLALAVDDLLDELDMVIKPLPEHMRRLTVVSGMVITGKNELVSVLHAPALLELARKVRSQASRTEAANHAGEQEFVYKILVVDDSLNTREIEKDVLEAWGYHVTLAEDGIDGLQQARTGTFDAILTDVEMPNMDGFTLTSMLRQEEKYRDTPIVIITSREKEEDKRRGIQVGADAYIVKGEFDQNSLVDTLRSLLG